MISLLPCPYRQITTNCLPRQTSSKDDDVYKRTVVDTAQVVKIIAEVGIDRTAIPTMFPVGVLLQSCYSKMSTKWLKIRLLSGLMNAILLEVKVSVHRVVKLVPPKLESPPPLLNVEPKPIPSVPSTPLHAPVRSHLLGLPIFRREDRVKMIRILVRISGLKYAMLTTQDQSIVNAYIDGG